MSLAPKVAIMQILFSDFITFPTLLLKIKRIHLKEVHLTSYNQWQVKKTLGILVKISDQLGYILFFENV